MIQCYKTLLDKYSKNLTPSATANANYFIGFGFFKQNAHKECLSYLEAARKLDIETYGKSAGLLMISSYFILKDIDKISSEINLAIDKNYANHISSALVAWAGTQSLENKNYEQAIRFYSLIVDPKDPRKTPREVWRNLAKAQISNKRYEQALGSIENVIAAEDNNLLKADIFLEQARCNLLMVNRLKQARVSIESCFDLRPQGALEAQASIIFGDICMAEEKWEEAKQKYAPVATLIEDSKLRPQALYKLVKALEKQGDQVNADKYRRELETKFKDWRPES
jgi:tetratricopeptide (TPR) repeat protein